MIYFILLISIFTSGCSFRSKELLAFDKVTANIDRALIGIEGFQTFGSGYLGPGIKGLHLLYNCPAYVDRNEARRIFIRGVDIITTIANQDKEFLQYLNPSPLDSSQLLLNIQFHSNNTNQYIEMIMAHDKINYYYVNSETLDYTEISSETLEEARAIIES